MLEYMLVIIAVIAALVAIIVNRRSLIACVVITAVSAALCCGFLLLYENTHKLGSYGELVATVLIGAAVLTAILIVVTFIGVKMHFMKKPFSKKSGSKPLPFEVQTPAKTAVPTAVVPGASKYGVRPTPVGIFGRQPIAKPQSNVSQEPVGAVPAPQAPQTPYQAPAYQVPVYQAPAANEPVRPQAPVAPQAPQGPAAFQAAPYAPQTPAPQTPAPQAPQAPVPVPKDPALVRMLTKGEQFVAMKQYVLAEQMFTTYIQRCNDASDKIDAELKLLNCHIEAADRDKATARLNEMITKMRQGEYVFSADQKRTLAECKMRLMRM